MTEQTTTPARAYDLLEPFERTQVDEYVNYAISQARLTRTRIAHQLSHPIPSEYVRRSKGVLSKPLARAAVTEALQAAANDEDVSPSRIIKEHAVIAFSNIADYMRVLPQGDFVVKSLDEIPRELLAAVKSMKTIPSPYGIRTEITMQDKQASLKVLTELTGLVAPDRPPPLQEYVGVTSKQTQQAMQAVPEQAYVQLLESQRCAT
jgi:hypothetical protein